MSQQLVLLEPGSRKARKGAATAVNLLVASPVQSRKPKNQKKKGKSRKQNKLAQSGPVSKGLAGRMLAQYVNSANNPFEFAPPALRFGCFCPTTVERTFIRGSITAASDGGFAMFATPFSTGTIQYNNGAGPSTTWTGISSGRTTFLNSAYTTGRLLMYGLRVFMATASTTAPGEIFTSSVPDFPIATLNAQSPTTISQITTSKLLVASNPTVCCLWRPLDPSDYDFSPGGISLFGSPGTNIPGCTPIISGLGWPASATIYYEYACYYECATNPFGTTTSAPDPPDMTAKSGSDPSWFKAFPSLESFVDAARPLIDNSSRIMSATNVLWSTYRNARVGTETRGALMANASFAAPSSSDHKTEEKVPPSIPPKRPTAGQYGSAIVPVWFIDGSSTTEWVYSNRFADDVQIRRYGRYSASDGTSQAKGSYFNYVAGRDGTSIGGDETIALYALRSADASVVPTDSIADNYYPRNSSTSNGPMAVVDTFGPVRYPHSLPEHEPDHTGHGGSS